MNFQAIQQANGQQVVMFGKITEFKGEGKSPTSGKAYKKVTIIDDANEKHTVTLRGTLPSVDLLQQRAQFSLSVYQGTLPDGTGYTGYSGFWNSKQQVNQVLNMPANAPQTPQNQKSPARAANIPPPSGFGKINEDWARCKVLCAYINSKAYIPQDPNAPEVYKQILEDVKFIMQGEHYFVPEPDPSIQESPQGDDIPFEDKYELNS